MMQNYNKYTGTLLNSEERYHQGRTVVKVSRIRGDTF